MSGFSASAATTLSSRPDLFKYKYDKASKVALNMDTAFNAAIKSKYDFTGSRIQGYAKLSIGKGGGGQTIPYGGASQKEGPYFTPGALFVTSQLDLESVLAASNDEGAFERLTIDEVEDCVTWHKFMREFILLNNSSGVIATVDASATGSFAGSGPWTVPITDASWNEAIYEVGALVNFASSTEPFLITGVDWTSTVKTLTVGRHPDSPTTSYNPAAISGGSDTNIELYKVNGAGFVGMRDIATTTDNGSNTLYNTLVQPKWQAHTLAAAGAPLTPELVNNVLSKMKRRIGECPDLVLMHDDQFTVLVNQLEGQREYTYVTNADLKKIEYGVQALSFRGPAGEPVKISTSRFMKRDEVFFTYQDERVMHLCHRPQYGWITNLDNGDRYLRDFTIGSAPKARALFGGYFQFFHHPGFLGYISGLQTPSL